MKKRSTLNAMLFLLSLCLVVWKVSAHLSSHVSGFQSRKRQAYERRQNLSQPRENAKHMAKLSSKFGRGSSHRTTAMMESKFSLMDENINSWSSLTEKLMNEGGSSSPSSSFRPLDSVSTTLIDPIQRMIEQIDLDTLTPSLPKLDNFVGSFLQEIQQRATLPQALGTTIPNIMDVTNSINMKLQSWISVDSEVPMLDWDTIQNYYIDVLWNQDWLAVVTAISNNLFALYMTLPLWIEIAIVVLPSLLGLVAALAALSFPDEDYRMNMEPYPRGDYDPAQARSYYSRRPILVAQRLLQLLRLSNKFLINILLDKYIFRNEERQRSKRAEELLELITNLGPTAIKVGQALSVRPDLIPEEYAKSLATLQDQVPPFDGKVAQEILKSELGLASYQVLKISNFNKPIASASIGQVYKGTIRTSSYAATKTNIVDSTSDASMDQEYINVDVAIKVQRPNVLAEIALDLYLVREIIAPLYQKVTKGATDLQSLANEWGRGFIAELDYRREAISTKRFNDEMKLRNLNAVCAPQVIEEYSTERILVTEWIEGTRLDFSSGTYNDVPRLCAVALNAYLVMLLELKSLHCDPHPGNLLRTSDGRLCILDFGMTLDIKPDLQYSLLEFVAHLTSENYEKLPEDLAALGFLKKDKVEYVRRTGVLEPLKFFLRQANKGGGAKGVRNRIFDEYREKYPGLTDDELRIEMRSEMKQQMSQMVQKESVATGITVEIEDLQRKNRDSFQIPEWFLYSSRAFLTLEGVSLAADENYSLIKACFPYVAKRLVADDDPRARNALKELLYGASDSIDVKRITDIADGFTSYTTTTKTINTQATAQAGELVLSNGKIERVSKAEERKLKMIEAEAAITLAKDSADLLLAPDGNLVQSLLVEESALSVSANFKDFVRSQLVDNPRLFRESLPLGLGSILPPLPFEARVEPFVRKTEKEIKAQKLAEKIASIVQARPSSAGTKTSNINNDADTDAIKSVVDTLQGLEPEQAALVLKEIRENVPRYAPLIGRVGSKFAATLLHTASTNIEQTLTELEQAGNTSEDAFVTTVKSISTAAQRSAEAIRTS